MKGDITFQYPRNENFCKEFDELAEMMKKLKEPFIFGVILTPEESGDWTALSKQAASKLRKLTNKAWNSSLTIIE